MYKQLCKLIISMFKIYSENKGCMSVTEPEIKLDT